ncbi:MAG TPA: serine/threonine-protein kinase [Vicinamibacterales bacterium]|nr:serine/threonine-protein kinase [Vicinamibacterales bacterium]
MPDWSHVTRVFNEALEHEPGERAAFLTRACAGDPELEREVASLLAAHHAADAFLEVPAAVAEGFVEHAALLEPGGRLGPYRVEREIGRGGMGVVYLATDTRLNRPVALKVLAPEFLRDPKRRERLRNEARAAAALAHGGIATVYALEEIDECVCLVSEYLKGETLRDEIRRGPLPVPRLIETGIALAHALAAAHDAGVVHRDLKPENVRRDEAGQPHILDFGIARVVQPAGESMRRLTQTGMIVGTPGYMSPEQLDGRDLDGRSDIFSFGVLLFEMATAQHPFETNTPVSTAARVLTADPPRMASLQPGLPSALEAIVRRCLKRDPDERYQSAHEVAGDLEALRAGRPRAPIWLLGDRQLPTMDAPGPARTWWAWHQVLTMAVAAAMVVPVARLHALEGSDWTLLALLATVATAVVNGTVRAHLLFTHGYNRSALLGQVRRSRVALQASSLLFAASLLAASLVAARRHTAAAALLAAVALGWAVASLLIEPSTRRAAFGHDSE